MILSVWCLVLIAVLYVSASDEDKGDVKKSVSCSLGYEFETFLDQFAMISAKLQAMENKFKNVEVKLQSVTDNLHSVEDKLQSLEATQKNMEEKLDNVEKKTESKLLEIQNEILNNRYSQEKSQNEMFAAIQKLEQQVAPNLSDIHNLNQRKVRTVLHKLDNSVDNVHNITRQIMNALAQLHPITEIPQKQERLTTTEKSISTTTTPKPDQPPFTSCKDVPSKVSGTYLIRVKNDSEPFKVYCEQQKFGGRWIVFQYRYDGSLDFYRDWNEFRDGFGDLNKEFWLGLEKLHQITRNRKHELVIELKDFRGNYKYARFDAFKIGSESGQYMLKKLGKYSGTAGDAMYKGRMFSTKDRDNDEMKSDHCAVEREGAWWHKDCTYANLNGRYMKDDNIKSMYWWSFDDNYRGLSYSRMMIRELE